MLSTEETHRLERLSIRTASSACPSAAVTLRQAAATGHGLDFHDFRRYQPGDDPRRIDWTIAARHRQLVVRQFRAEGHVRVHLLVDVSRSMTLGLPPKLASAAKLAAALGYAAGERGDAIGLATFDRSVRAHVPPASGRAQLFRVFDALQAVSASGESNIDGALQSYGALVHGPGLAVVLSDFFQPDLTLDGVRFLQYRALTPALVQIVSDEELQPHVAAHETIELTDIERPGLSPVIVRSDSVDAYLSQLAAVTRRLREFCASRGLPFLQISSSTPFERMLTTCVDAGLLSTVS